MRSIISFAHLLFLLAYFSDVSGEDSLTAAAFKEEEIVPDMIKVAPNEQLQIQYGDKYVQLGTQFKLSEVAVMPKVNWTADSNNLYALIKVDPDALSRTAPIYRSYLHWMVLNIPGSQIENGQTIITYRGAGAPPKTGLHRYVFLVYQQKGQLKSEFEGFNNQKRQSFDVEKFVEENDLSPLFGNFYVARHED